MRRLAYISAISYILISFSGCKSTEKVNKEPTARFEVGNNYVDDLDSRLRWSPYHDNPTSLYRYQMGVQRYGKKLPTIAQLTTFFNKVTIELNQDPGGFLRGQTWLTISGDYPSNSETTNLEQKKFHHGIRWNYSTKQYEKVLLAGGDLVYILEISKR